MSLLPSTSAERENPNQILQMYSSLYRKSIPQRNSGPHVFFFKENLSLMQNVLTSSLWKLSAVFSPPPPFLKERHTIWMYTESEAKWNVILNGRAYKHKEGGCQAPLALLALIQTEHFVFCFSWYRRKLHRKISISIGQIKNIPTCHSTGG
jgi:hypothetical protein